MTCQCQDERCTVDHAEKACPAPAAVLLYPVPDNGESLGVPVCRWCAFSLVEQRVCYSLGG